MSTPSKNNPRPTKSPHEALPEIKEVSRNVHEIHFALNSVKDTQWILLRSDCHHDSVHCDRAMEKRHLDEAVEKNALIIDNGDLYDAMQGKYDRRSSKDDLRPEYKHGDYLDKLVSEAYKFYKPYAKNIAILGQGNHETAILKHHETNLTERLKERLNIGLAEEEKVHLGGYGGWVRLCGHFHGGMQALNMHYFHGSGGGGPVTRGVIQTNRQAVFLPDANICLTGHTHDQWLVPIERQRINNKGRLFKDTCYHIKIAGYKEEYEDGFGGWHIERGAAPKPRGACWLELKYYTGIISETDKFRDRGMVCTPIMVDH
jgi:hypothetical protein